MTHHDTHPGSLPEDRFDHWLDGLVAGTPADAASLNGTDGSLGRAMSGARQLHGLAAGTAPAAAAQRRIEEDLMRSGTLAAPRGTTWIPIEESRRVPWWSPTSPVIAAALVVALIVALGASFIATQRPTEAPIPAPGFAMASPSAMEPTPVSSLPILVGEPGDGVRSYFGAYGVIDKAGLTISRPGEADLVFPGVSSAVPYGVPGEAMLVREDGTRFVADLTTGETRFNLPNTTERQVQAGTYLFVSETGENADWTVWDLRTGDSRPLSEIVDLPADPPAIPEQSGIPVTTDSDAVAMHFVTPEFETSPLSDVPAFLIAGSVDNAVVLEGYPPATQVVDQSPVISDDRAVAAWITTGSDPAIVVVEVATGDTLVRFDVSVLEQHPQIAGFLNGGETLVVTTRDQILLLSGAGDSREQQIVAEGLHGIDNPLLYAPTGSLYFVEDGVLKRITIPDADITVIMPDDSAQAPLHFTASGAPWIVTNEGGNAALIDARTGEVVSRLRDVPANPAEFGAYSTTTSSDGSTLMFQQGGLRTEYTAWLVSPRFPDGLSFTAPLDSAMIEPNQTFPVMFSVSPDGDEILVDTVGDTGLTPRLIGQVAPDPAWVQVDGNLSSAYWLPMPATEDEDADTHTLPAQDFATPMASPTASGLSCASPGYLPVVSGDVDGADLSMFGAPDQVIRVTDDGVTVPLPDGGETTLPPGSLPVTSVPGTYVTVEDDGSRTVTSIALDETWAFPALDFSATGSDAVPAAFSFVATGPYVAGPVDETGLDWRIIDIRIGEEVTTSERLDGLFPWMVVPQSAPRGDTDLQAITFVRATQSMPEITSEVVAPEGDATDHALNGTVAAILPGSLADTQIVDLGGITPLMGPIASSAAVYNTDGTLAAWRGWEDNGEDAGFFAITVARTSDLATPLVQLGITSPPASVDPLAFSPDGSELYVRDGMTLQALSIGDGTVRDVFAPDAESMGIQAINADAETIILAMQGANGVEHMQTFLLDLTTGEARHLPELDGFSATYTPLADTDLDLAQSIMLATFSDTGSDEHRVTFQRIVNTATGEIVAEQGMPVTVEAGDDRLVTATGASGSGLVVGIRPDGTLGVLDGTTARSWTLEPPADVDLGDRELLSNLHVSPSGSCLLLNVERRTGTDGDRVLTEHIGSWIAPLEPDAEWTKLPFALEEWWPVPTDERPAIPTQETPTPTATPAASAREDVHTTSFVITAKDDIYLSVTVDGLPVFDGDLPAGQSTEAFTGSDFEVYTTSGENTLFTNSCGTPPFNMGYEPGEAYYILKADAASCPPTTPETTPAASPAASGSCGVTAPNGDIPPGENADLDWLGSGTDTPSLWLMMTWNDGTIATNQVADGYPVKLTFWRGEGSGEITVTATGPDGETLPANSFKPFQGDPIPGLHPVGGTLPSPGCWTFTATDGNDTLAWTVEVQATPATPVAADMPGPAMVVEGTADDARIGNGVRIATIGAEGLTLPVGDEMIRFPDAVSASAIYGIPGRVHVINDDGTEAVIDLATGDVLFELPSFMSWARGTGRWQLIPTDDTLTDWTVIDMASGETRLLSDLVDLPGDTAILPITPPTFASETTPVLEITPGRQEGPNWVPAGPAGSAFVIGGSLDRVATLPDYPTTLDSVGTPALVSSADGGIVAYETRSGDDRIIVLDTATGEESGRYGIDAVGDNPTLAGFSGTSSDIIVTTDDGRVVQLAPDGRQPLVLHEGLGDIADPLLFRDGSLLYVRQVNRLLMIEMLPGGVVREVATGIVPVTVGFTTPHGNMIVAQTQDGHILVDARTGEIVSRLKAPANIAEFVDATYGPPLGYIADEGETIIFAVAIPPSAPPDTPPTAWLLSPDFPDGLEVTAPENTIAFWLSPDGETLYAFARVGSSDPGTVWATTTGEDPDWQPVVEHVSPVPSFGGGLMIFPAA